MAGSTPMELPQDTFMTLHLEGVVSTHMMCFGQKPVGPQTCTWPCSLIRSNGRTRGGAGFTTARAIQPPVIFVNSARTSDPGGVAARYQLSASWRAVVSMDFPFGLTAPLWDRSSLSHRRRLGRLRHPAAHGLCPPCSSMHRRQCDYRCGRANRGPARSARRAPVVDRA